jgi:hypothetical protein
MAPRRTYWAAHGSPEAVEPEKVSETNFVVGFDGSPDVTDSYTPPANQDLHIVSIGMSVEPNTPRGINGRLRMRKGAGITRAVFWTHVLVALPDSGSSSEVFSFPEGTFVIPAGQKFCFTAKTAASPGKIHFVANGYLEPRTS